MKKILLGLSFEICLVLITIAILLESTPSKGILFLAISNAILIIVIAMFEYLA
jgi:hypothetical protein